jgi:hypothetical protein
MNLAPPKNRAARRAVEFSAVIAAAALGLAPVGTAQDQPANASDAALLAGYHNAAALDAALRTLAQEAGARASVQSMAKTAAGRDVWLVTIAAAGEQPPEQRQAILVVGGIDADHPAGGEVSLLLCRRLLDAAAEEPDGDIGKLLEQRVIYVIPRANPDGYETIFEPVARGDRLNARAVDDDRDGVNNEDGPNDLDGDGVISVMRVRDLEGRWMVDPDDARLMKKAEANKGEVGIYKLMLEGIDDDADGLINEDGPGGVDDDRNWPHFYERGDPAAGRYQISEPETRAIAEFVVAHPHITAAIVYGRHDNIVKPPKGKDRGVDGESYRDLHPDDVEMYEHISKQYKDVTGLKESAGCDPSGALYSWLYNQRGIPTFATSLWSTPDEPEATTQPTSKPGQDDAEGDEAETTEDDADAEPGPKRGRGGPGPRGEGKQKKDEAVDDPVAARVAAGESLRKWLAYSDTQRDGAGFVEWHAAQHPTFGEVELGGLRPCFSATPPADELTAIAQTQATFLAKLSEMLPAPRVAKTKVELAGAGVWKVELTLANDAYLPTHSGIARQTGQPPFVVRAQVDAERIVGASRLQRVANLAGSGGVAKLRWLIRGNPDETVTFRAFSRAYGELMIQAKLEDSSPQEGAQ